MENDFNMNVKKKVQQNKSLWIIILLLIGLIKFFSADRSRVEAIYTSKIYFWFSNTLRFLFGWLPFSVGDILYLLAGFWIIYRIVKNIFLVFEKKVTKKILLKKFLNLLLIFAFIYVVFNIFWGINYNREGIAYQLKLKDLHYDTADLILLQNNLIAKVNASKNAIIKSQKVYPSKTNLIIEAKKSYVEAAKTFPFLQYRNISVKSSFFGTPGDYLGFTGYYNPFTGEAQINTTVPPFLQPYIATHEMAHQLGYAKEDEANFVGYLAAVNSTDTLFHYSAYFDLFLYTNREVYYFDSVASIKAVQQLIPGVREDIRELRKFDLDHQSFLEPAITWMYGNYLKLNNQPKGMHSYNAVVGMLIAYYKKFEKI